LYACSNDKCRTLYVNSTSLKKNNIYPATLRSQHCGTCNTGESIGFKRFIGKSGKAEYEHSICGTIFKFNGNPLKEGKLEGITAGKPPKKSDEEDI